MPLPLWRQRSFHAALSALSLLAIVVITVRQTSGPHSGRIVGQLSWLQRRFLGTTDRDCGNCSSSGSSSSSGAVAWLNSTRPAIDGATFDPFNQRPHGRPSPTPVNGSSSSNSSRSFPVIYPNLYRSLTRLTKPPGSVAKLDGPAKPGLPACKRPVSKVVSGLLPTGSGGSNSNNSTSAARHYRRPQPGGFWSPSDCWPPLSRTAVLVPYRNRSQNLDVFVPYMQALLQQQGIVFGIFVVEQANDKLFNRAKLLNIGFKVAQNFSASFDCFVFQDADKVPENVANVYDCAGSPKLMISEMRPQDSGKYSRGRLYGNFFGGSAALSKANFERVNGNSNRYYGWGREDDELAARLGIRGLRIRYPSGPEGRFVNLQHGQDIVTNKMPWPHVHLVRKSIDTDGLSSVSYGDRGIYLHDLFVLIRADV